jgi:hypothetical protein
VNSKRIQRDWSQFVNYDDGFNLVLKEKITGGMCEQAVCLVLNKKNRQKTR